jgi:hypothetical protein
MILEKALLSRMQREGMLEGNWADVYLEVRFKVGRGG